MSKLVKTIFDTCIAKINEKERTSILDKLYAESKETRSVFLAKAKEVAKSTPFENESVGKIIKFGDYLKQREVLYKVTVDYATCSSLTSLKGKGQTVYFENLKMEVFATDKEAAENEATNELWEHFNIECSDMDINVEEVPVLNSAGNNNFKYEVA
ncbi:hypothetical protein [Candidatus Pelagibacter sp.]|uniref:hypothetical protein n=1 Tax=Candidatus Pelagibacter sp. TaxID=2024849 RepID=UPI003F87BDE9